MKKLLLIISVLLSIGLFAQHSDTTLVEKGEFLSIYKTNDTYFLKTWKDSVYLENLKYALFSNCAVEVISQECQNFRLYAKKPSEKDGRFLADTIRYFPCFFVCGTVPHYIATIEKNDTSFLVYQDEYFYDRNNSIPKELIVSIPFSIANNACFINGKQEFTYDANYGISINNPVNPLTIIVENDNGLKINYNERLGYFQEYLLENNQLIITKNGLKGIFGHTECIYKEISAFHGSLAKFTDVDNREGFISTEGKIIYCD